jgi:hypothetical protein
MRTLLLCAALGCAAITGCQRTEKAEPIAVDNLPTMTPDEVEQALASGQAKAIDCNGDRTRKKHGVLPGAILISDEELYAPTELPADKAMKLIFYCADPG